LITKGVKQLVEEANKQVEQLSTDQVRKDKSGDLILVDIRDIRELEREGIIPGAVHTPRGMLEFWVDPESPYHKDVFAQEDKTYVLYCQSSWRSALAAKSLQDMGMKNLKHITGGFKAWKETGGPVSDWSAKNK
jgi:rhodanese-related sulfurtransferase